VEGSARGGSYQSEINLMKNGSLIASVHRQTAHATARPQQRGGTVMPGFTLELSGPCNESFTPSTARTRAWPRAASPLANTYTGPITLDANARIVARARNPSQRQTGGPPISSPWSSPVAGTFVVNPPRLIITELMFHPEPPPAGSTNAASDFEFLELENIGATPINLFGFRFLSGIDFTFTSASSVTNLAPGEPCW
jgi:hypothetical protein